MNLRLLCGHARWTDGNTIGRGLLTYNEMLWMPLKHFYNFESKLFVCTLAFVQTPPSPQYFLRGGERLYRGYTYIYAFMLLVSVRFLFFV